MSSYLAEFEKLKGKSYRVAISWRRNPSSEERQHNIYTLSMTDHDGLTRLGDDPLVQIAKHIKNAEKDWSPVARGSKRIKVDVHSEVDRSHEGREANEQYHQWLQQRQGSPTDTQSGATPDVLPGD